jgi:hypothetical protein
MYHPTIHLELARQRQADLLREARRRSPGPPSLPSDKEAAVSMLNHLTIRLSQPGDAAALRRLADLDSRRHVESGAHVLAESDGELVAALPLGDGAPMADPFRPTADVVRVLELRARQLRAAAQIRGVPNPGVPVCRPREA